jgi:signal peptidase II
MRVLSRITLIAAILIGCVGCDQATKAVARSYLADGETHSYLYDLLRLSHAENPGGFLSLGASLPEQVRVVLFTATVGLFSALALLAAIFARSLGSWHVAALALISAGGVGNWIDRLVKNGQVTDFLNVGIGPIRTGIFNVADVALMLGLALLLMAPRKTGFLTGRWSARDRE